MKRQSGAAPSDVPNFPRLTGCAPPSQEIREAATRSRPGLLYEGPFTDVAPQGPEQVYDDAQTTRLFEVIEELSRSTVA